MGEKGVKSEDGVTKKSQKEEGGGKDGGEGEKSKKDSGGGGDGAITVVLKVDMHCDGCAKKVKRSVTGFQGVETVTVDGGNHKLTVVGKVDPWKLRERVEVKTHKAVVLVSPTDLPKKEKEAEKQEKKVDEKPKEPVVSTVLFKTQLHCEGCIQKIRRCIFKVKGVEEVKMDMVKDVVAVKGTMDAKTMVPYLAGRLKRTIEVVPEKKEKEKVVDKGEKEGKKKEKWEEDEGGEKKKGDGGSGDGATARVVEVSKMDYHGGGGGGGGDGAAGGGGGGYYAYNYPVQMLHAPQYFSDENPNACSVM